MCKLGWESLGVFELTAQPSKAKTQWVPIIHAEIRQDSSEVYGQAETLPYSQEVMIL